MVNFIDCAFNEYRTLNYKALVHATKVLGGPSQRRKCGMFFNCKYQKVLHKIITKFSIG